MKRWRQVDRFARSALHWVLPPRCLLCGAPGTERCDLCAGCRDDLAMNAVCCPRCALPLEVPAPLCGECLRREPPFDAAWVPFRYAHPLDVLETRFKFGADLAAGRVLSEQMVECARLQRPSLPELLVPVPLHRARLRERGFNQALELARPLAAALGVALRHDLLLRTQATPAQTGLDAKARRRNLRGVFAVAEEAWSGSPPRHVVLFDDVMTTGATMRECARVLRRAGIARVDVWALARAPAPR